MDLRLWDYAMTHFATAWVPTYKDTCREMMLSAFRIPNLRHTGLDLFRQLL